MKHTPPPSNHNQGSECGCRVYYDGWYKVAYCPTHIAAAPEVVGALKRLEQFVCHVPTDAQLDARMASGDTGRQAWHDAREVLANLKGGK